MKTADPDHLKNKLDDFFPTPKILFALIEAIHNPDSETCTVENLIKHDTAFTAKILSMANSAYYGYEGKISNIHSAIVLLGFKTILNMTINICAHDVFHMDLSHQNFTGENLWKHSVGVSLCAKHLSSHFGMADHEDFITLGILHDIGLAIEAQFFKDEFITMLNLISPDPAGNSFFKLEKEIFAHDHAFLSHFFCEHWHIPSAITQPILFHHDFNAAPEDIKLKACILNLADIIVSESHFGFFIPFAENYTPDICKFLNIGDNECSSFKESFLKEIHHFAKNIICF